jgi:hypothetical protein
MNLLTDVPCRFLLRWNPIVGGGNAGVRVIVGIELQAPQVSFALSTYMKYILPS